MPPSGPGGQMHKACYCARAPLLVALCLRFGYGTEVSCTAYKAGCDYYEEIYGE